MERIIIDINSRENTNILLNLLKKIDFVKSVKLDDKKAVTSNSKILLKMSSKNNKQVYKK